MTSPQYEPVIIDCLRTPVGKAHTGRLSPYRPEDLAAVVIEALCARYPEMRPEEIDEVILGSALVDVESGGNVARLAVLRAGLPDIVPAFTVNRLCASGLEAIVLAADRIAAGRAQLILAGGAESMSFIPLARWQRNPNPRLLERRPEVYLSMGLAAEHLQERYRVSRQEQDEFALESHRKAVQAQEAGRFDDEIIPVKVPITEIIDGRPHTRYSIVIRDELPRADTSMEALSQLPPAFKTGGTVTAGNASPLSDGAAVALIASRRKAEELGWRPRARLVAYAVAGVPPELMGIGPVVAVPKALAWADLRLEDMDLIELNEAFAVQALVVARQLKLPMDRVNVNGGAIALGHPLGATGARLVATLLYELARRRGRYGLVTLCVGGGQGVAAIFENLQ